MFYFGIPLRSRESSRDWDQVCERFRITIRSVMRQTAEEFTVLIACHDLPNWDGSEDPRVKTIRAPFDSPSVQDYRGQMVDQSRKIHLILNEIKRLGPGHYMQVDADDLVSNRIVEFVQKRPKVPGWIIRFGFEYRVGADSVQVNPLMNRHCATTHVVRVEDADLPEDMTDADSPDAPGKYVLRRPHHAWPRGFAALGRPFRTLPFVGCIYVTGYSDNHSLNQPRRLRKHRLSLRRVILAVSPKIAIKKGIRDEFGL